jgi:hypothetical protein
MTLPTCEAIRHKTRRKPLIREKPAEFFGTGHQCTDGLLPSIKRNIYESVEMFYFGLQGCPSSIVSLL